MMEGNEEHMDETEAPDRNRNSSFLLKDEDSLDVDLYGDLLAVDLNQEMTYPEVKTNGWFSIILLNLLSLSSLQLYFFQFQTQKLKDENFVLKKNISSLYLTAREEIKRKDAQIRNLQDKEVRNRKILAKSQQ
ncbi:CASP8-associated protein 2-like [Orbicella faveolata]|uniref:CASP8-associated protein 2-like n=1 Tax=Orbicella faveolata TaxID=48498 RepID=UPI0009E63415|nr:CASP8-associated protein 2-like [Orbicella faveolata]